MDQLELSAGTSWSGPRLGIAPTELCMTLDVPGGCLRFEWQRAGSAEVLARGRLTPISSAFFRFYDLDFSLETNGVTETDRYNQWPASTRAFVNRLRNGKPNYQSNLNATSD